MSNKLKLINYLIKLFNKLPKVTQEHIDFWNIDKMEFLSIASSNYDGCIYQYNINFCNLADYDYIFDELKKDVGGGWISCL